MTVDAISHPPPRASAQKEAPPQGRGAQGKTHNGHRSESIQKNQASMTADPFGEAPPSPKFKLLTDDDLEAMPPVPWLVRGVLPATGIAAIFGPSGSGKSFLTLDLLASIAEGGDWFGCRVKDAPVLYVGLEGEAGIAQRVKARRIKRGPCRGLRYMLTPMDIRSPMDRAALVEAVKAAGWADGVLCIDTLNRAAPGMDENSSQDMGEVIGAAKAIQAELGGLVLLVHHTGKDSNKGLRGHSSLIAALDCAIAVSREADRRAWKVFKAKDGADGKTHPFTLRVVELGMDEDGEPVTSCVVQPEEAPSESVRRALPPKAGNQRVIWDALGELFRSAGTHAPQDAPSVIPRGRPCLRLDEAITSVRDRLVCDPKRQTERTQSAITGLITRGNLAHREGWIWCV